MASPRATKRQEPAEAWRIMRWRSRHRAHREQLAEGVGEKADLDKQQYTYIPCIVLQQTGDACDTTCPD